MKNTIAWILAIAVTLAAVIFQRLTGPTYPVKVTVSVNKTFVKAQLPRSHETTKNCPINLDISDSLVTASLKYKLYPGNFNWEEVPFERKGNMLTAFLPAQPKAGKLAYTVEVTTNNNNFLLTTEPVIIRFKGPVPAFILIPHIVLIFLALIISTSAGFYALFNLKNYTLLMWIALLLLTTGGMILGPFVQHYAFGKYWTGFPFGYDLTDNKTLIVWLIWIMAAVFNLKNKKRFFIIFASAAMLVVYSIPHSLRGSELNRNTGTIETGE